MRVVSENEGRRGLGVERASFGLCWWGRPTRRRHASDGRKDECFTKIHVQLYLFLLLVRFWVFGVESQRAGRSSKIISKNEA